MAATRSDRRAAAAASAAAALAVALALAGAILLQAGDSWHRFLLSRQSQGPSLAVAGALFGVQIVRHRPRIPIGWLFLVNAICYGLRTAVEEYAVVGLHHGWPAATVASWLATPPLIVAAATLPFIVLLFPDGQPTSPAWKRLEPITIAVAAASLLAVGALSWSLRGPDLLDGAPQLPTAQAHAAAAAVGLGQALLALCALVAVCSLVPRYRASVGVERQQLRWFAVGAVPSIALIIAYHGLPGEWGGAVATFASLPLLVGITVAVRRYRLYEIDRFISRSISYAALTAVLAGVYVVAAVGIGWLLGSRSGSSTFSASAAGVAVAVAFQPMRRALQDVSDRRFRRRAYEASRVIRHYVDAMHEVEPEPGALRACFAEAMHDTTVEVAFWLADYGRYVDESGSEVVLPEADDQERAVTRLDRGGQHLGMVTHQRRLVEREPEVLESVARAAAVALDHGRLRAQVMLQVADVRASRARIVAAGDAERHKIERDLHDGAQQRLVALGLSLRILQKSVERLGEEGLVAQLEAAAVEAQAAFTELRELARGLVPPVLSDLGLAAAVRSLAERSPLPATVDATTDDRYDAPVETAAYFVVAEALTNVVKYADADWVRIVIAGDDGSLHVEIIDDGRGGAAIGAGSGLTGLLDRVDAVGGRLHVVSPAGKGTTVVADFHVSPRAAHADGPRPDGGP